MQSNKDKILLSFIVPVVNPDIYLERLFISISELKDKRVEMILINQSGKEINEMRDILQIQLVEHITSNPIPASNARNLGASIASGEYLFFLDDDAFLYSPINTIEELLLNLENEPDVLIAQRGEVEDNRYISHWSNNTSKITYKNFPRFVIEWNLIIRKSIFTQLNGFDNMGPGSDHAALCGEAFVLISKIIGTGYFIQLYPSIQVAHPGLFKKVMPARNALGYSYATGYAVGRSLKFFDFKAKIYWVVRFFIASIIYDLFRHNHEIIMVKESINYFKYKLNISKCKIIGFFDSLFNDTPKSANWLSMETNNILSQ
jgi:glycosyltransferase involved in cell wall biosynthesis